MTTSYKHKVFWSWLIFLHVHIAHLSAPSSSMWKINNMINMLSKDAKKDKMVVNIG